MDLAIDMQEERMEVVSNFSNTFLVMEKLFKSQSKGVDQENLLVNVDTMDQFKNAILIALRLN